MSDATTNTLGLPFGKMLPVTGSFAIPLVVTASLLSLNVVKTRIDNNTFQGEKSISKDGKEAAGVKQPDGNTYDPLLIATRVHGNMMENMPITLVLAALAELNGADRKKLTTILAAFSVIRIAHVVGLTRANQLARAAGYFGTQFVQLGLVGWLGLLTKGYWGY
ncbi:hypothetical protein LTR37_003675 [Vermiconidia calcicola]|uniref:Uncharacterized protein n=1 Tax=Vermiconidia calcicola TaxID=1690605 RepID=A0ACC3NPN0_9PEZI|nr:hypothetical protein LTR37_003675 [Vermiconidia calcicola]